MPTLALADEGAHAALDAQLVALGARCRVELALPRFAAFSCNPRGVSDAAEGAADEPGAADDAGDAGDAEADHVAGASGPAEAVLFSIEGSTVTRVELLELFLEGAEALTLLRRLQYDPSGGVAPMVLTSTGIKVRFDRHHTAQFSWRTLAPLLRPDSALAEALAGYGVVFPASGTPFPGAPPVTVAIWDQDPWRLLARWGHLPQHLRRLARLIDTGGPRPSALIFPPGVTLVGYPTAPAFYMEPLADVTLGRSVEVMDIVSERRRRRVLVTRPPGTLVTMVQGTLDGGDSVLGHRTWAFVRSGDTAGWARGHTVAVVEPSDCLELPPPAGDVTAHEQGTFEDGGARYAWFLTSPEGQPRARVFSIHVLAGCTAGPALHQRPVTHRADAVHVFTSGERGGHALIALLDRQWPSLESTLVVFEARRAAPVLELRGRVLGLEVGASVGPDLELGYFPLKVLSGAEQTWYTWTDDALVAVPPPATVLPAASAH